MKRSIAVLLAATLLLSACGGTNTAGTAATSAPSGAAIQVVDVWARAAGAMSGTEGMGEAKPTATAIARMGGANGAAYLTIRNTGGAADRLIKASSDVAKTVELHTVVKEGDVMQMRPVPAIDVPAGGETMLKPGGFHVMLIDLQREIRPGDQIKVTLQFEHAGTIEVQAEVRK